MAKRAAQVVDVPVATPRRPILHAEFAKRMELAVDGKREVPRLGHGRLAWVSEQFKTRYDDDVGVATVQRWFSGMSRPREKMLRKLAAILDVDTLWLGHGISVGPIDPVENVRRSRTVGREGKLNLLAGLLQISGVKLTFPDSRDRVAVDGQVHFYAMIHGAQYRFHVVLAEESKRGLITFDVPRQARDTFVVGLVMKSPVEFDLLEIRIDDTTKIAGSEYRIEIRRDGSGYRAGDASVRQITSFSDRF